MSKRPPRFARFSLAVLIGAIGLVMLAPAAQASAPSDVCAEFPHQQTYLRDEGFFRGPAWHFDRTVTIKYDAATCVVTPGEADDYVLAVTGTASIYEGGTTEGEPIKQRPFTSTIRSNDTDGKLGWPVAWWTCFDGSFNYVWSVEDVYTFAVTATDGRWAMLQRDPRSGQALGQSGDACRPQLES